jgi:hypothetical protein
MEPFAVHPGGTHFAPQRYDITARLHKPAIGGQRASVTEGAQRRFCLKRVSPEAECRCDALYVQPEVFYTRSVC